MTLILLPNLLHEKSDLDLYLPSKLKDVLLSLDGLIAESEKSARRYLLKFLERKDFEKIKIRLLNEHTKEKEIKDLLEDISCNRWGLISDAGLPCIADPGSELIGMAREKNISIRALFGPCSIFLALMLSGLNGQKFFFQGYLPKREDLLVKTIRFLEKESFEQGCTQIFIEAPYRSDRLLRLLLKTLSPDTSLCVAINLTAPFEKVITSKVKNFKKMEMGKNPAIFLFQA